MENKETKTKKVTSKVKETVKKVTKKVASSEKVKKDSNLPFVGVLQSLVVSDSLQLRGLQHASLPCPSNSCQLSQ